MSLDLLSSEALLKLAVILHENYRSVDMVSFVLAAYDGKNKSDLQQRYMQKLMNG